MIIVVALISLCAGSFLNVIVHRLPLWLHATWQAECAALGASTPAPFRPASLLSALSWPASHCPHCQHRLRWWHNLPLCSFILLRGRCAFCQHRISWRYPLVEICATLLSLYLYVHFHGFTPVFLASLCFSWLLLSLIMIDIEHQLLPDQLTLLLLWIGLLCSIGHLFVTPSAAIIGAISGYTGLSLIAGSYRVLTGRDGMGQGDSKLLAAIGAWVGWQSLLGVILFASLAGAIAGGISLWLKRGNRYTPFAFGPYLALAGWIMLLWGPDLQLLWLGRV